MEELASFRILGVLNVTPDSFSDGGQYLAPTAALSHLQRLIDAGADFVDMGAESTRPGSEPVDASTEWARLEPVLLEAKARGLITRVSVDTRKPDIMLKATALGVRMINCLAKIDASSTWLADLGKVANLELIAMHMHGEPKNMQASPLKGKTAVEAVDDYFELVSREAAKAKVTRLWLDPGIGFGKDDTANILLLGEYANWSRKYNMVAGISRKSFLGRLFGIETASSRDDVSNAMELGLIQAGARLVRTHRVDTLQRFRKMRGQP